MFKFNIACLKISNDAGQVDSHPTLKSIYIMHLLVFTNSLYRFNVIHFDLPLNDYPLGFKKKKTPSKPIQKQYQNRTPRQWNGNLFDAVRSIAQCQGTIPIPILCHLASPHTHSHSRSFAYGERHLSERRAQSHTMCGVVQLKRTTIKWNTVHNQTTKSHNDQNGTRKAIARQTV